MSRLPEPGDARLAFDRMDARAMAAVAEIEPHYHHGGSITLDSETGSLSGGGLESFRAAYGDLFDIEETLTEGGFALIQHGLQTFDNRREDLLSVLMSLVMQSVGIGVLQERARWERKP